MGEGLGVGLMERIQECGLGQHGGEGPCCWLRNVSQGQQKKNDKSSSLEWGFVWDNERRCCKGKMLQVLCTLTCNFPVMRGHAANIINNGEKGIPCKSAVSVFVDTESDSLLPEQAACCNRFRRCRSRLQSATMD